MRQIMPMMQKEVEAELRTPHARTLALAQAGMKDNYEVTMLAPEIEEDTPCKQCGENDR